MLKITLFLPLVFFILEGSHGQADCEYSVFIEPGSTLRVNQPGYPWKYTGQNSCRWTFKTYALSRIKITCDTFYIPPDSNNQCTLDNLKVYANPNGVPFRYCGTGDFSIESDGPTMILTLNTVHDTPGGFFSCAISTVTVPQCNCGLKNPKRIVGGVETGVNEYPMMAGLVNLQIDQLICGATIISKYHVISVAHCINKLTPGDLAVLVGDHDISTGTDTNASRIFRVLEFRIHPSYIATSRDFDIAVITVSGAIIFSDEVGPACLPFKHASVGFDGANVDILGWGTLDFGGPTSDTLQKAQVNVYSNVGCKSVHPEVNSRQICTYGFKRDSCQFDSGGPVLWQDPATRRFTLIGLISYGIICGGDKPGVNTRVGSFMNWIVSVTSGVEFCQIE